MARRLEVCQDLSKTYPNHITDLLRHAQVPRSTWYRRQTPTHKTDRRVSSGRPVPGYTVNRDGVLLPDTTIAYALRTIRSQPFFEHHGGIAKMTSYLQRDYGFYVNHKKVARILREQSLLLQRPSRRQKSFKTLAFNRSITGPNQLWEFDIKYGYVAGEQRFFFVLAFVDVFSRKCVGSYVGKRCQSGDLIFTLKKAIENSNADPDLLTIRSDNGPQMSSRAFHHSLQKLESKLCHEFIPVRSPNKNAHVESFFSILERELLAHKYYVSFAQAYRNVHQWIQHYNCVRIHGSLKNRTPNEILELHKLNLPLNIELVRV